MYFYDPHKNAQSYAFCQFLNAFDHARASGDMVSRFMPNSGSWDALGPELWLFLSLMSALIFVILDIFKYMRVYEGIWLLFEVYEGTWKYKKVHNVYLDIEKTKNAKPSHSPTSLSPSPLPHPLPHALRGRIQLKNTNSAAFT